jgi:hypothetical protein
LIAVCTRIQREDQEIRFMPRKKKKERKNLKKKKSEEESEEQEQRGERTFGSL